MEVRFALFFTTLFAVVSDAFVPHAGRPAFHQQRGQGRTPTSTYMSLAEKVAAKPDIALAKQMLFADVVAQCVNSTTGQYNKDPAFEGYYNRAGFTSDPVICIGGVQNDDCCIVSTLMDAVVVAFRGTTGAPSDWLMDAQIRHGQQKDIQNPPKFPGLVHTGFLAATSHVWSQKAFDRAPFVGAKLVEICKPKGERRVRPDHFAMDEIEKLIKETGFKKVYITGHSKGGAMASLASWFCYKDLGIVPECYTFASPYPGDKTFAAAYNNVITQFSYENYFDIVPLVPPPDPMYISDLMRVIPGKFVSKVMQTATACVASLIKLYGVITPGQTLTQRLFDYVPVGERYVMKEAQGEGTTTEIFEFAAGDYVGEFEDFRDQRWKDISRRLSKMPIKDIGASIGAEHSKRCSCDPLVASMGVYTALVKAEGKICEEIAK